SINRRAEAALLGFPPSRHGLPGFTARDASVLAAAGAGVVDKQTVDVTGWDTTPSPTDDAGAVLASSILCMGKSNRPVVERLRNRRLRLEVLARDVEVVYLDRLAGAVNGSLRHRDFHVRGTWNPEPVQHFEGFSLLQIRASGIPSPLGSSEFSEE